jgi:hypothetical protein
MGHLGCFHDLAIVNSAAINMGVQVPLLNLIRIPSGISPGVILLDHMVDLLLVFEGASILFSIEVVLTYFPSSSV